MTKPKTKTQSAEAARAAGDVAGPKGKLGALVALLLRPEGATLEAMQAATGWQAHSVRGAIAGQIRKKLGLTVATEKVEGLTIYRITAA